MLEAENLKRSGHKYIKELDRDIPFMILNELSADKWNRLAEKENTKRFTEVFGRAPEGYSEVKAWIANEFINTKENSLAGNETAQRIV